MEKTVREHSQNITQQEEGPPASPETEKNIHIVRPEIQ